MAGKPKTAKQRKLEYIKVEPGAWGRFQKTMDKVVPPKRRKPGPEAKRMTHEK